jgi:hypothetical protein
MDSLKDLARRTRHSESDRELGFLLVNDTLALANYRQAALWLAGEGVWSLSGVVQVDANVPYAQWLDAVCQHMQLQSTEVVQPFNANQLPEHLAADWAQWWPEHALWIRSTASGLSGGAVLVREAAWDDLELASLNDWAEVWWHAFAALHRPRIAHWNGFRDRCAQFFSKQPGVPWWRQRRIQIAALLLAVLAWPVRLSILSPGELVPSHPFVIRAPLDGVIDVFHVQPNQQVTANQALFSFDEMVIQSKLEIAQQTLATAETDYRQTMQLALNDAKSKVQLGVLAGKIEERRADIEYLQEQLVRARVLAPQPGVVLMDDPSEWIGKPVAMGERILRIATIDDVEIEAWVSQADAISLSAGDSVSLYLSSSPLAPVSGTLRYMAHDAVQRPDGGYAYRVRATLEGTTGHRVGLKGTAKLQGQWVPLIYWMMRRPVATVRAHLGW